MKKKVIDIFTGLNHWFLKSDKNAIYGWGRNNFGQLGINNFDVTKVPIELK